MKCFNDLKLFCIIVTFACLPKIVISQTDWSWINPFPQGNDLNYIKFTDSLTAYSVGNFGAIIKTTNGGATWFNQISPTTMNLYSFSFPNSYTGYATGGIYTGDGIILKTTNAGLNWNTLSNFSHMNFYSIYFISPDTGFIAGQNFFSAGPIYKTVDGGINWVQKHSVPYEAIQTITFVNSLTGYAAGSSSIIRKTTNGGENWFPQSSPTGVFFNSYFQNDSLGYIGGTGIIIKTTNSGSNWIFTWTGTHKISTITFADELTGFATGSNNYGQGILLKTTNQGVNWNTVYSKDINIYSVSLNHDSLWFVGSYGIIFNGPDTGSTWNIKNAITYNNLSSTSFPSPSVGYIAGYGGIILKSINGGVNWQQSIFTNENHTSVFFTDIDNGFLVSNSGIIYKTTNGGINWLTSYNDGGFRWNVLYFVSNDVGFAGGRRFPLIPPIPNNNVILKTTNAGLNWQLVLDDYHGSISTIQLTSLNIGYAVSANGIYEGKIYKTDNSGNSWYNITPGGISYVRLNSMRFYNNSTGYVSGNNGYLIKTTNGGSNWTTLSTPVTGNLISFFMIDSNIIYIGATGGAIIKTTNGGTNWFLNSYMTGSDINSIFFTGNDTGFAVGSGGLLLKTTSGSVIGIQNPNFNIPEYFALKQNYPNPFNPNTNIYYDLPVNSKVNIIIYDILGRGVKRLVNNEIKHAGSYIVVFNASNYASGVYFYRIEAEEPNGNKFVDSKKMVLLK